MNIEERSYLNRSLFPEKGESGITYIDIQNDLKYRWSQDRYVLISSSPALKTTTTPIIGVSSSSSSLFEKINIGSKSKPNWIVKPLKIEKNAPGIVSDSFISCRGLDPSAATSSGFAREELFSILTGEPKDGEYININYLKDLESWLQEKGYGASKSYDIFNTTTAGLVPPTGTVSRKFLCANTIWEEIEESLFDIISYGDQNNSKYYVTPKTKDENIVSIVSNGFISCKGLDETAATTGGSIDMDLVWHYLAQDTDEQINKSHLTQALSDYSTKDWVTSQGYLKSFTETDPTVPSHVKKITNTQITSWDLVASLFGLSKDGAYVYTTQDRGIVSNGFISCRGLDPTASIIPTGLTRDELFAILTQLPQDNSEYINLAFLDLSNYVTRDELNQKEGLTIEVADARYASLSAFNTLNSRITDFLSNEVDVDDTINRWKELEKFLQGYTETVTLADLLQGKLDKSVYDTHIEGYNIFKTSTENRLSKLESMWFIDPDNPESVRTTFNVIIEKAISFGGVGQSSPITGRTTLAALDDTSITQPKNGQALIYSGGLWINKDIQQGLDENALYVYLTDNKYATQSWVNELFTASNIKSTLGISDWALAANKPSYKYSEIGETPSSLKNPNALKFGAKSYDGSAEATITADDLGALTAHQAIYKLSFVAGSFTAGDFTANAAAKTFNIPTTTSHIAEGDNLYFTNTRAVSALTETLKSYVTLADAQTISGVKTFSNGLKIGDISLSQKAQSNTKYIEIDGDLVVTGAISFGGFGQGTGGEGGLSQVTVKLGNDSYTSINGVVSLPAYPSLSGYATEQWVADKGYLTSHQDISHLLSKTDAADTYQPKGNYLTSVSWGDVSSKPTTLAGYGITDAAGVLNGGSYVSINASGRYIVHYGDDSDWRLTSKNWAAEYKILHSGNYSSYALPLSGGTISASGWNKQLSINRDNTSGSVIVGFYLDNTFQGGLGFNAANSPIYSNTNGEPRVILTQDNYSSYALPLSGGILNSNSYSPLIIDTTNSQNRVQFRVGGVDKALVGWNPTYGAWLYNYPSGSYLHIKDDGTPCYNGSTLIHSGNIGSQSVNYANGSNYTYQLRYSSVENLTHTGLQYWFDWGENSITGYGGAYKYGLHIGSPESNYYFQVGMSTAYNGLYGRFKNAGTWDSWREIAFTDSNVASATKLQTARSIWGQSFDGTKSIGDTGNSEWIYLNSGGEGIYIDKSGIYWHDGSNEWTKNLLTFFSSGNVRLGDGEDDGTYKLQINGGFTASSGYVSSTSVNPFTINSSNSEQTYIWIKNTNNSKAAFGWRDDYGVFLYNATKNSFLSIDDDNIPRFSYSNNKYTLIHSGNIGSYNAGSATKLANSKKLWGNSFNGENDINGNVYLNSGGEGIYIHSNGISWHNSIHSWVFSNLEFTNGLTKINPYSGNVLIGTSSDFGSKVSIADSMTISKNLTSADWSALTLRHYGPWSQYMNYLACVTVTDGNGVVGKFGVTFNGIGKFVIRGLYKDDYDKSGDVFSVDANGNTTITGSLVASGAITFGSDARYKHKLDDANISLEDIANAPLFNYRWTDRDDKKVHLGTTAQYWNGTAFKNAVCPTNDEKLWTMSYSEIAMGNTIVLARELIPIKSDVQILKERVDKLENILRSNNIKFD